jgi:hypothetical protein
MQPVLSRRLAKVVGSPLFSQRGHSFKFDFIHQAELYSTFEDMPDDLKEIVLLAEESINSKKNTSDEGQ